MVEVLVVPVEAFFGSGGGQSDSANVKYVCLVCRNKHNGGACPRCGSKMQRADF